MKSQSLLTTTIDQYSRQKWASNIINTLRKGSKRFTILDVGGYKGRTADFSPKDDVTICDLFDVNEEGYVKGDGRKLPFDDDSFDFVVSFDTYEHVPREGRKKFVSELVRVAKQGIILAAPFDNEHGTVHLAEVKLNDFHKALFDGKDHPWLYEHIEYVIPNRKEIESLLDGIKYVSYSSFGSNSLKDWIQFQTIYFAIGLDDDLRGRSDDMTRFYNQHLEHTDLAADDDAYRRIYFITKDKSNLNTVESQIRTWGTEKSKKYTIEFSAIANAILGLKYRDTQSFTIYLSSEVDRLKKELEDRTNAVRTLQKEVDALMEENGRQKNQRIVSRLKKRLGKE